MTRRQRASKAKATDRKVSAMPFVVKVAGRVLAGFTLASAARRFASSRPLAVVVENPPVWPAFASRVAS